MASLNLKNARELALSVKGAIVGAGALAGAIAAIIGLLPHGSKPCSGTASAAFDQVVVKKQAALDALVSYTIQTHGYRGQPLDVVWTLFKRGQDGSFHAVPGFHRVPAATITPTACSLDQGGADIQVPVEESGRYQVELELLPPNGARITFAYTDSFRL